MLHIRWLGAAGLECRADKQTVLIDPYLTRLNKRRLLVGRLTPNEARVERYLETLPAPLSAILVGHTHVDHALDVPAFARRMDCPIVGSRSLDRLLSAHGLPGRVRVCRGGETLSLGEGMAATLIASEHGRVALGRVPYPGEVPPDLRPPLRLGAYRHGTVFILKLELGGKTLVHVGSAYLPPDPAALGDPFPCDALFVGVGGWKRAPRFVPRLLDAFRPRVVVPFHWDDFTAPLREGRLARRLPFVDVAGFAAACSRCAPQVEVRLLRVCEEMAC